jgi:DNA-binding CsgD family transcriptional regulator
MWSSSAVWLPIAEPRWMSRIVRPPRGEAAGDATLELARSREAPPFYVVDDQLEIVFRTVGHEGVAALPEPVASVAHRLRAKLAAEPHTSSAVGMVSPTEIVRLLRLDAYGGAYHYAVFLERFAARNSVDRAVARFGLSPREGEVLDALMRGESTNEMSARLGISGTTVQEHIRKIGRKTNVTKRSEIVAMVIELR